MVEFNEVNTLMRNYEGKILVLQWFLKTNPSNQGLMDEEIEVRKEWIESYCKSLNSDRTKQLAGKLESLGWLKGRDDLK